MYFYSLRNLSSNNIYIYIKSNKLKTILPIF